jgi:predicted ATPase
MDFQIALGASLVATKGWGSSETERTYTRALELCQQIGEPPNLIPVLFGLGRIRLHRAEYRKSIELGKELLRLGQDRNDSVSLLIGHAVLGMNLFWIGEFTLAREHAQKGSELYDSDRYHSLAYHYGLDPGLMCLACEMWALWFLGYPDQALEKSNEGLSLARKLSHPLSLDYALALASFLHQFRRETGEVAKLVDEIITISTEHGISQWLEFGNVLGGWSLSGKGRKDEGIMQMRKGVDGWLATGAEIWKSHSLALLAEEYGKNGQVREGLTVVAEALAAMEKNEEVSAEVGLYRIKGELLLKKESDGRQKKEIESEAESCFHKSLEVARRQKAKSLELQVAMCLSRLWKKQGKKEEAKELLGEIYGWFTEGFDTLDLKEAKTLLEELS